RSYLVSFIRVVTAGHGDQPERNAHRDEGPVLPSNRGIRVVHARDSARLRTSALASVEHPQIQPAHPPRTTVGDPWIHPSRTGTASGTAIRSMTTLGGFAGVRCEPL